MPFKPKHLFQGPTKVLNAVGRAGIFGRRGDHFRVAGIKIGQDAVPFVQAAAVAAMLAFVPPMSVPATIAVTAATSGVVTGLSGGDTAAVTTAVVVSAAAASISTVASTATTTTAARMAITAGGNAALAAATGGDPIAAALTSAIGASEIAPAPILAAASGAVTAALTDGNPVRAAFQSVANSAVTEAIESRWTQDMVTRAWANVSDERGFRTNPAVNLAGGDERPARRPYAAEGGHGRTYETPPPEGHLSREVREYAQRSRAVAAGAPGDETPARHPARHLRTSEIREMRPEGLLTRELREHNHLRTCHICAVRPYVPEGPLSREVREHAQRRRAPPPSVEPFVVIERRPQQALSFTPQRVDERASRTSVVTAQERPSSRSSAVGQERPSSRSTRSTWAAQVAVTADRWAQRQEDMMYRPNTESVMFQPPSEPDFNVFSATVVPNNNSASLALDLGQYTNVYVTHRGAIGLGAYNVATDTSHRVSTGVSELYPHGSFVAYTTSRTVESSHNTAPILTNIYTDTTTTGGACVAYQTTNSAFVDNSSNLSFRNTREVHINHDCAAIGGAAVVAGVASYLVPPAAPFLLAAPLLVNN